jgi:soluble lytic murein transglycosylase-like protein
MTSDIQNLITQYASAAGVPPAVALAVATQESGGNQYKSNGSLVTGSSGEIGIFQLMPATAAQLGVDPTDANQNIQGGVSYLAQLYAQFGDWKSAIAAYNAGPGRVASGNIPSSTQGYVASVTALINSLTGGLVNLTGSSSSTVSYASAPLVFPGTNVPLVPVLVVGLGLLVISWIVD